MSESEQRKSLSQSSSLLRSSRRRRRRDRIWFFVSLCLHIAGIVALVYLTPVREIVREAMQPSRPEKTMSSGEMEKLADAIEYRASEQVADNARELKRVLGEIDEIRREMSTTFETFEERQRREATVR